MSEKTIAAEIDDLHRMTLPELRERFEALFGYPCRFNNRTWLRRRCAWMTQAQRLGGLSAEAKIRLQALVAEIKLPVGGGRTVRGRLKKPSQGALQPGSVLARDYKGEQVCVTVRENGFEWNGAVFPSLSAVAKAVTGAKWNGKLFFGLTARKKKDA